MNIDSVGSVCEMRSFTERDIDVWLAEELRVNGAFARWFANRANLTSDVMTPAHRTRVSVMSENGETDVEAIFLTRADRKCGLLVENKIEHSLSADQITRYYRRGAHGVTYGYWDEFKIAVFAPATKIAKYSSLLMKTPHISFEEAASFLAFAANDLRASYRSAFLARAAIEQQIDIDGADAFRISFWKRVHEILDCKFHGVFAVDPNQFPKTTFIAANFVDAPSYFRVDVKGHMGEVDLAFKNVKPGQLLSFLEMHKPQMTSIALNKRSIALQIKGLPRFFVGDGLDAIETNALPSFEAAHTLLNFWKTNRTFFDAHYAL